MAPAQRLETCLYRQFQRAQLLIHEGPTKDNVLPTGIENGTKELSDIQRQKLRDVLSQILDLCSTNIEAAEKEYAAVWSDRDSWVEYARTQKLNGVDQAVQNMMQRSEVKDEAAAEDLPDAPSDLPGSSITSSIPQSTGDQSLKYDVNSRSIEDEWFEHNDPLIIKGDPKETIILFEKIFKYKGDLKSHYGVQRRIGGRYCFEMVRQSEISFAINDWNKLQRKMIIKAAERSPISKDTYGGLHKYWGTAYMVPRERDLGPCRSPGSECIMQINGREGFTVMTFTSFVGLEGSERAEEYIEATSLRDGVPTPWKTHSQVIRVQDPACHRPQKPRRSARNHTVLPTESPSGDSDLDDKISRIVEKKTASLRSDMIALDQRLDLLTNLVSKIASKLDVD